MDIQGRAYRVQAGDTLAKIADENNVTVASLIRLNNIQLLSNIWIGQVLKLPPAFSSKSTQPSTHPDTSQSSSVEDTWVGAVMPSSVALRSGPHRKPSAPYRGIIADLPRGTTVSVLGRRGGWLCVEATFGGKKLMGYISQELVKRIIPQTSQVPPASVSQSRSRNTIHPSPEQPLQVQTIEDFLIFVDDVEREYPQAKPAQIATEIRQIWYSDVNWEILVAGQGLSDSTGRLLDIETKPNIIAQRFDMTVLAPARGGKELNTSIGLVDIGHVMAGIDARLNGFPTTYPAAYLKATGHEKTVTRYKYDLLKRASMGDARDFSTWAGDLGQAYADYLLEKYITGNPSASLTSALERRASDPELLGDIHGYIAVEMYRDSYRSKQPADEQQISDVLRNMYLPDVPKNNKNLRQLMEQVSGQKGEALRPFVRARILDFAAIWFAKNAYERRGWWSSKGWGPEGILESCMAEFNVHHADNETATSLQENKLDSIVDKFLTMLSVSRP